MIECYDVFFFFSSRRRHTRCYRDWSSDVCSSDLVTTRCHLPTNPAFGVARTTAAEKPATATSNARAATLRINASFLPRPGVFPEHDHSREGKTCVKSSVGHTGQRIALQQAIDSMKKRSGASRFHQIATAVALGGVCRSRFRGFAGRGGKTAEWV